MNDAYGDPRNYDPNDDQPFDYANYSPTWGNAVPPENPYVAPAPAVAAPPAVVPPATGGARNPNAGPDGSTEPNMDPPGVRGGYWMGGQWVGGSPYGGSTGGGEGGPKGTGQFDYGRPMGNQFTPYQALNYQPFDYAAFEPSNRDMLYDDKFNPGFVRSQERLRKMIEAGAAYQGVLRSGNTFDRLGSILSNNEESAFKAFDDRRARDYGINRGNKFENWGANLGVAERENQRSNDFRFNTEKATADDVLSRWQQLVQSTTALARPS